MDEIKAALEELGKEAGTVAKTNTLPKSPGKNGDGADPASFAAGVRYAVRKLKGVTKKLAV